MRIVSDVYHVGNAGRFEDVFIRASATHHHREFGQSAWSNLEEGGQKTGIRLVCLGSRLNVVG